MQVPSYTSTNIDSQKQASNNPTGFISLLLLATAIPFILGPLLRNVYTDSEIAQQFFYLT